MILQRNRNLILPSRFKQRGTIGGFQSVIAASAMAGDPIIMSAGSNVSSGSQGPSDCGNPGNTGTPGASASGGEGALTYLWELTSAPATNGPYNISSSSALNPNWGEPSVCFDDNPKIETWRLTVTDEGTGNETDSITVLLTWFNDN